MGLHYHSDDWFYFAFLTNYMQMKKEQILKILSSYKRYKNGFILTCDMIWWVQNRTVNTEIIMTSFIELKKICKQKQKQKIVMFDRRKYVFKVKQPKKNSTPIAKFIQSLSLEYSKLSDECDKR